MKANDFVNVMKGMLGWGYVLGAQGELYTPELAQKWGRAKRAGKSMEYFTGTASKWYGKQVADCSGAIMYALGQLDSKYADPSEDRTADDLYAECTDKGPISTIPEIPGLCVHKPGHIGVYLGGGKVIESRGVAYGVVITELKDRPWTGWGKLTPVTYDIAVEIPVTNERAFTLAGNIRKGARGSIVEKIQAALNTKGANPLLKVDGIFGSKTDAAVKTYQDKKHLKVDGIVGKQTTAALGGRWAGK